MFLTRPQSMQLRVGVGGARRWGRVLVRLRAGSRLGDLRPHLRARKLTGPRGRKRLADGLAGERRLRGSEAVTAQGVAMLGGLLTDPASPLYRPSGPGELASRLRAAAAALEPQTIRRGCDATDRQNDVHAELAQPPPVVHEDAET